MNLENPDSKDISGLSPKSELKIRNNFQAEPLAKPENSIKFLPPDLGGNTAKDFQDSRLRHHEFLFDGVIDPSLEFLKSLQENIGEKGSVIVWNKGFECKINNELAERQPDFKPLVEAVNTRVYDLMEIFSKQYFVDKNFHGRVSIKKVLPVLVPDLSYKALDIKEGGTASQKWNEMTTGKLSEKEKEKIKQDLKIYCGLDTYAMYAIWKVLHEL